MLTWLKDLLGIQDQSPIPKEIRLEIYKRGLDLLMTLYNRHEEVGFCYVKSKALYELYSLGKFERQYRDIDIYIAHLPELWEYAVPLIGSPYWFPTDKEGLNKRIAILKDIINKLEKK